MTLSTLHEPTWLFLDYFSGWGTNPVRWRPGMQWTDSSSSKAPGMMRHRCSGAQLARWPGCWAVQGNPLKALTGQNLQGTWDVPWVLSEWERLKLRRWVRSPEGSIFRPETAVRRVDCSLTCRIPADVYRHTIMILHAFNRKGACDSQEGDASTYVTLRSPAFSFSIYDKGKESSAALRQLGYIHRENEVILRVEARCGPRLLKAVGCDHLGGWDSSGRTMRRCFHTATGNIGLPAILCLLQDDLWNVVSSRWLPEGCQKAANWWRSLLRTDFTLDWERIAL